MRQRRSAEQVRVARRVRAVLDEHRLPSVGREDPGRAIGHARNRSRPPDLVPAADGDDLPITEPWAVPEARSFTAPPSVAAPPSFAAPPSTTEPPLDQWASVGSPARELPPEPLPRELPPEPPRDLPAVAGPWGALPDEVLPSESDGDGDLGRHMLLDTGGGVSAWLRRRGIRLDPGHRGGMAMGIVALVAALVAGWWVLSSRPQRVAVASAPPPSSAAPAVSSSRPAASAARLVVDVVGKVRHPGVYRLPDGARVADALHAAGGAATGVDLTPLNLARKLTDGEQIAVGVTGAPAGIPAAGGSAAASAGSAASGPIDLNTATLAQLDSLPGVGPVLAQRILDWRTTHGRFDSVDQLRDVSGIGDSRFADLKSLVTV